MDAAIWGLLGTIVGALASAGTAWIAASSASKREREKLVADRAERASAFQRQTLIELQDSIHAHLRLVHRAHIEDAKSQAAGTPWASALLTQALDEDLRTSNTKIALLNERMASDDLRTKVKSLMAHSAQALLAKSEEASKTALSQVSEEAISVLTLAGTTLRSHY